MVFSDAQPFFPSLAESIDYLSDTGFVADYPIIKRFDVNLSSTTKTASFRNFNFTNMKIPEGTAEELLSKKANDATEPNLESYDYPNPHLNKTKGDYYSKIEIERLRASHILAEGYSDVPTLHAGYFFTLNGYPQLDTLDTTQPWLVKQIRRQARQPQVLEAWGGEQSANTTTLKALFQTLKKYFRHPLAEELEFPYEDYQQGYRNCLVATPQEVTYRPARLHKKPQVLGSQTAIVTGPEGEEIYCDEYGRVKVQFHWDREGQYYENSSYWIRVASNWAHDGYGAVVIPRVGMKVMINFMEGDPDAPMIVGALHNGVNKVPYDLPANKTRSVFKTSSSKGGIGSNELRIEDKAGQDQIFVQVQKDFDHLTKNNHTVQVLNNSHLQVQNEHSETIVKNRYQHQQAEEHHLTQLDRKTQIMMNDHTIVGMAQHTTIGTVQTIQAGQEIHIKAGMNLVIDGGLIRGGYNQGAAGFASVAKNTSLPTVILVFSLLNFSQAVDTVLQDRAYNDIKWMPFLAASSGVLAATASVWQTAHTAILDRVVKNINKMGTNLTGAQALTKIGRLNVILGAAGQIFGGFVNYYVLFSIFSKWWDALLSGDTGKTTAAVMSLTGNLGNAGVSTYGLIHSGLTARHLYRDFKAGQMAARTAWAIRGARFASALGKATPWGLFFTALQLGGELIYNHYDLSEVQQWFEKSCWGNKNKGWDQQQHNQQLALALLKPMLIDQGAKTIKDNTYRVIQAIFPGQLAASLKDNPIQWQAQWQHDPFEYPNVDTTLGETLRQQTVLEQNELVILQWHLPWLPQDQWSRAQDNVLLLRLFYTPEMASEPLGGKEYGLGYKISLKKWTNDAGETIKQVAGDDIRIRKEVPLISYYGEIYDQPDQ